MTTELTDGQKNAILNVVTAMLVIAVGACAVYAFTYKEVTETWDDVVCVECKLVPHSYYKYRNRGMKVWRSTLKVADGFLLTFRMKLELDAHYKVVQYENFLGNDSYVLTKVE